MIVVDDHHDRRANVSLRVGQVTFRSSLVTSSASVKTLRSARRRRRDARDERRAPAPMSEARSACRNSSRPSRRTWRATRPGRCPPTANITWTSILRSIRDPRLLLLQQARRDSNPHPADLESAALPIRATGLDSRDGGAGRLSLGLLRLLVVRVLAAARTVLAELELVRRRPLVLVRVVVALLAILALERDRALISTGHDLTSLPQNLPN